MVKSFFPIVAASAMLLVAGCSREFAQGPVDSSSGQEISFRTMGGATKSAVSGTVFPQGYDILVSAYHNPVSASGADYFEGIPFGYDAGSGSWKSEKGPKYYPMEGTLDFLAVASAGYNNPDAGIAPTAVWGESDNAARKAVLTVPDNSAKFDDLMYGAANGCSSGTAGSALVLRHAMTSVVFFAKSNVAYDASTNTGITITGITLDGAKFSGTLTVSNPSAGGGSGDLTAAWSSLGDQKDHIAARVWDSANSGVLTNESALSALHLSTTAGSLSTDPFGEAYVILPPQAAVPFTISYTIHNGFASDGTTPVNTQFQTQITPSGNWDMEKKNVYQINFNLSEISINPSIVDWDSEENDPIVVPEPAYDHSFAGLQVAAGPLMYDGNQFVISSDWRTCSYNSKSGLQTNSTFFSFLQMGELFEKAGFSSSDGDIENLLDPLDGWRMPTIEEWKAIIGIGRPGATVNGMAGKHYALINLSDISWGSNTRKGLLLFPDRGTVDGVTIDNDSFDTTTPVETSITSAQLQVYLDQDCVFMPATGMYYYMFSNQDEVYYWSSTESNSSFSYHFDFFNGMIDYDDNDKGASYYPVWLVKE